MADHLVGTRDKLHESEASEALVFCFDNAAPEIKQTRPSTKQDFSGEALSKQNTEASLASFSYNSSWAPTEWSAIFAFGV